MSILALSLYYFLAPLAGFEGIHDYQAVCGTVTIPDSADPHAVIRSFNHDGRNYYLLVNCIDLSTRIVPSHGLSPVFVSPPEMQETLSDTPYMLAVKNGRKRRSYLQNSGITRLGESSKGICVTADLCPSHLSMDRIFLSSLAEYHRNGAHGPLPVAFAVSGMWMEKHQPDLRWLLALAKGGLIDITWINHSYSHRHLKTQALRGNYLLIPGTNVENEVFRTEMIMIQNGITPTVFFRFPGLVSNGSLYDKITGMGLIPVGSNAWLAKSEKPVAGSIILVHANGNEPDGIRRMKDFLARQMKLAVSERLCLLNLRKSIAEAAYKNRADEGSRAVKRSAETIRRP